MRKLTLAIGAATAIVATPAIACLMHQSTAQTTRPAAAANAMMCAAPAAAAQAPQLGQPAQPGQAAAGCTCCRNMAMMHPQQPGGMQNMPGMQQGLPPSPPASPPETPRPN